MLIYSFLLALGLVIASPWWLWRMATSGRYRAGLGGRLGQVPAELRAVVDGKRVVWIHAVSVGEVLAAERLVREMEAALPGWVVAVSTTTASGQKIARERFGAERVFYLPLDFAWIVRRYLRALKPELLVTMESELWPRVLVECERVGVPVAVVNARVSDRSYPRYMRLKALWGPLLRKVAVFLAQGEESAWRLRQMGVESGRVRVIGNLKYDMQVDESRPMVKLLRQMVTGRRVLVVGSLVEGEEAFFRDCLWDFWKKAPDVVVILAPRHPQRFVEAAGVFRKGFRVCKASDMMADSKLPNPPKYLQSLPLVILDTLGDLAGVYGLADVAFIGGSLVAKGGHNPLEAARFGVPVVMGESYENFREMVESMKEAEAIRIVDGAGLGEALTRLMRDDEGMGERGRMFFEGQTGATGRAVEALVELISGREG